MSSTDIATLYTRARRHLSRRDPVLKPLIAAVGSCTLKPGGEAFPLLVRAIVAQMISTRAAQSISAKLEAAVGDAGLTPAGILALGTDQVRGVGLSGAKARAILDLAERASDGRLPIDRLSQISDEELSKTLTEVRGIGPGRRRCS